MAGTETQCAAKAKAPAFRMSGCRCAKSRSSVMRKSRSQSVTWPVLCQFSAVSASKRLMRHFGDALECGKIVGTEGKSNYQQL